MKVSWDYRIGRLMLPGLKRWIVIVLLGIFSIVLGVLLLLGYHPITVTGGFIRDLMEDAVHVLPHRISGILVITGGGAIICIAIARIIMSVLGAYLPADRESIPDVLYRRRHLEHGPRVVVVGGGTGLSNLLRGLKNYTNNITAVVTVGDDGGSSGRLRQELGVLPPGDIRNCITALADEDKLVTELFQYRFESGQGLEGHSFGNLFLTALCSLTKGDMVEAVRVASRVLNSCGLVLPASLSNVTLVAELEDGRMVKGESRIPHANGRIKRLHCEPALPRALPEAIEAILHAELVVLGPGSLYTSVIPNLLVQGVADAIRQSPAKKIYVCNVMTQIGETADYSAGDHVQALLTHAGCPSGAGYKFIDAVLVNEEEPGPRCSPQVMPVRYDPERLRELGVRVVRRPLVSHELSGHHDPIKLARTLIVWYFRHKHRKSTPPKIGAVEKRRRLAGLF